MKSWKKVMKRSALLLAGVLAFTSVPFSHAEAKVGTAITEDDFLKADGKNLKNKSGTGDVVNLRGTNAGGYFVQEFWMTPTASTTNVSDQKDIMKILEQRFGEDKMYELIDAYEQAYWTEEDFDNCVDMGMNCIRLPFWWRTLVDESGNFYGYDATATDPYAEAFSKLDWFIEQASERGLYVIVDFHGAPGSQNGSDHSGVDGGDDKEGSSEFWFGDNATENQELFYDMWEIIAKRYAGNPAVAAYDIMNEPFCTYRYSSAKTSDELHEMLWTVYDEVYDIIRSVDADHVVIMEAVWDPGDLPSPAAYGWENVMYEYHNYLYDDYDNAAGNQIANMQSKLSSIGNTDYNVPSYMGEFSYFNNLDAWDEGLKLLTESGINWTTWTYKTVDSYGNWGLYHHPAGMDAGINLETATYDEILAYWKKVGTGEGTPNTGLIEAVSKYCKADMVENQMMPKYAEIEEGTYYLLGNSSQRVLTNTGDSKDNMVGAIGFTMSDSDDVKFELIHNGDKTVSLKSLANDKYVSVDTTDKLLRANADTITDTEKFWLMESSATAVALKSVATELFACVDEDLEEEKNYFEEGFPLIANRSSATGWETYNVYTMDHKLIGEISDNNYSGWIRYEAEDTAVAQIHGGSVEEQSFYSGGQAAGGMNTNISMDEVEADWSNIKYVAFQVEVETAGNYQLVMSYNGDDDKEILVKVGDAQAQVVAVPQVQNGQWDVVHTFPITVDLAAGSNIIYISGTVGDGWMNLDCIDLIKHPLVKNEDGSERYEGENYNTNGSVEAQSFYSNGKGVGNMNSNTKLEAIAANWSNVKYVDFTIYAPEAGDYIVKWAWNGNGADGMKAAYCVNYGENKLLTLDNAGASWNSMNSTEFTVTLEKGFNNLKISGTIENQNDWANVDYIDVVRDGEQIDIKNLPKAYSGWKRLEGELAAELVSGGNYENNEFFSNGQAIGGLSTDSVSVEQIAADWSNIAYAKFTVNAAQPGDYRVIIGYNGDDDKVVAYKLNNGATQALSVPAVRDDHQWDVVHKKALTLHLEEGENVICLSGALGGGWWNIDYVDIANAPVCVDAATGAERYEAEDFDCKSANNPAAEHQDFYSGTAVANGVGGMGATYKQFEIGSDILDTKLNYIDYSIFVDKAGEYDITVAGNGNGADMTCIYQLNGAPSQSFQLLNAGYSWDHMVTTTIRVTLQEGYNRLLLAGTFNGDWLNYDYIDVKAASNGSVSGGDAGDGGNTGGDKPDSGNTGEDKPDSGNTGEDKSDSGNTGEDKPDSGNTGEDKPDSGNTGDNTGDNKPDGGTTARTEIFRWKPVTPEEIAQYSYSCSIPVEYTSLNEGVKMYNSVQGLKCIEVMEKALPGYRIARTYNIFADEKRGNAATRETEKDVTITLTIPKEFCQENRRFVMVGVDKDGIPHICRDLDKNENTVTFSTNYFYAYALMYRDVK